MIRKANLDDAVSIQRLIQVHAEKKQMLFRTLEDISQNIRDFFVFEEEEMVLGVCALSNSWDKSQMTEEERFKSDHAFDSLVEVRSLAVHPDYLRQGIGTALLRHCVEESMMTEKEKIFVLTYAVSLFKKLGFEVIDKSALPQKIWSDCRGCSKRDYCDETAMIRSLHPARSSDHRAEETYTHTTRAV